MQILRKVDLCWETEKVMGMHKSKLTELGWGKPQKNRGITSETKVATYPLCDQEQWGRRVMVCHMQCWKLITHRRSLPRTLDWATSKWMTIMTRGLVYTGSKCKSSANDLQERGKQAESSPLIRLRHVQPSPQLLLRKEVWVKVSSTCQSAPRGSGVRQTGIRILLHD